MKHQLMKHQSELSRPALLDLQSMSTSREFVSVNAATCTDFTSPVVNAASLEKPSVRNAERRTVESGDIYAPLSSNSFYVRLRQEKRRAERSHQPLSIAVYQIYDIPEDPLLGHTVDDLLDILQKVSRETDIIGYLDKQRVAVLCPETDEHGILVLARKIEEQAGTTWFSIDIASYPGELFKRLTDKANNATPAGNAVTADSVSGHATKGYSLKRSLDIVVALILVTLLSPLMLLVAILVAVTSPGPIIFKQTRIGLSGRPFAMFKFRSMVTNKDDGIHREFVSKLIKGAIEIDATPSGNAPAFKIAADPRITWIGHIIRRTSIDELPQLFNVLKGEMSLVGPRPPIPYEVEIYKPWHLRRLQSIKPGITGLWQVQARSAVTFDQMVRMDLQYIRTCSLGLDLKILLKTVIVVLRCDGAA